MRTKGDLVKIIILIHDTINCHDSRLLIVKLNPAPQIWKSYGFSCWFRFAAWT